MRRRALQARQRLGKPYDQDWLLATLSYLRCIVALGSDSHAALALLSHLESDTGAAREEFSHIGNAFQSATSQLTQGKDHIHYYEIPLGSLFD